MLGLEPGAVLGRSPLEFVHPEDVGIVANAIAEQRAADTGSQGRTRLECRFVTTTGTALQVLISGHAFFDDDGRYTGAQGMFTDITELKLVQEHLERLAVRDTLTGLANRTLVAEQLTTMLDSQSRLPSVTAAVCVDLDGDYTNVVDAFGHEEGDRLLVEAAERLASAARPGDIVGRFGAHEFVVLCSDLDELSEAQHIARRLHAAVAEPMEIGGRTTTVSAAVGIAHTPAGSAIELLRHAAAAAHRAGRGTPGGTAVFSTDLHDTLRSELDLLEDFRRALTRPGQLVLEYQPVMALRGEQPVGVEALVRWRHPQRGLLAPDAFIPLAEHEGLIPPLDRWVLHEATAQLAAWRQDGVVDTDFRVAVNVSGSHYTDPRLVEDVRATLAATGIPANNLVLAMMA
jgi:diguanylate cyclase (GGDEF)-like protein/PAS domain S-box-containing protein